MTRNIVRYYRPGESPRQTILHAHETIEDFANRLRRRGFTVVMISGRRGSRRRS